ncbi:DUF1127 domain-containing protein [Alphaproteobacteria bacterium KMM 3653]|uniref:DUF1127 domain-containing protein n=2 Tax=Harenicola maris TaxID=2841044 RepID=A0AAP2CKQ3_9RHOB|nr:DUF1127 domain-containing protein [Harenicola maris]
MANAFALDRIAPGYTDKFQRAFARYQANRELKKAYRATLNELQELSNRELSDLGMHRSNLRSIAYQAVYHAG